MKQTIAALKEAYENSTPGKWIVGPLAAGVFSDSDDHGLAVASCRAEYGCRTMAQAADNCHFVALSHNAMPELLDHIEWLETQLGIYKAQMKMRDDEEGAGE